MVLELDERRLYWFPIPMRGNEIDAQGWRTVSAFGSQSL